MPVLPCSRDSQAISVAVDPRWCARYHGASCYSVQSRVDELSERQDSEEDGHRRRWVIHDLSGER